MVTESEICSKMTKAGGWTKKQLAEWGVPWPPPAGWKERLIQQGKNKSKTKQVWFPLSQKPKKKGVYCTSRQDICHYGGGRNFWDGKKWLRYKDWGSYLECKNLVWHGEGKDQQQPLKGEWPDELR